MSATLSPDAADVADAADAADAVGAYPAATPRPDPRCAMAPRLLAWPAGAARAGWCSGCGSCSSRPRRPAGRRAREVQTTDPIAARSPPAGRVHPGGRAAAPCARGRPDPPPSASYEREPRPTAPTGSGSTRTGRADRRTGGGHPARDRSRPAADGQAAILAVPLPSTDPDALAEDVATIRDIVSEGDDGGLTVRVTGGAGVTADLVGVFSGINGTLLIATALVVAILLLLTYRSPFLWLLPLFTVFMADLLARAGMTALVEQQGLLVDGQIAGIVLVLVFGAGTDYALLLVARYREELRRYPDRATRWPQPSPARARRSSPRRPRWRSACCACSPPCSPASGRSARPVRSAC